MTAIDIFIRLDFANGNRIGHGKIALLEAIRANRPVCLLAREIETLGQIGYRNGDICFPSGCN